MIKFNSNAEVSIENVGFEKTPLIKIDQVFEDISPLLSEAHSLEYVPQKISEGVFYPGSRATMSDALRLPILQYFARLLGDGLRMPDSAQVKAPKGVYSLLSTPENRLAPSQCAPHFDKGEGYSYAVLIYLNPGEFGGTAFYRHRQTGYENISSQKKDRYLSCMRAYFERRKTLDTRYFSASDDSFELIHEVDYLTNRAIIYPSTIIHALNIKRPDHDVSIDPRKGRLTANFFITFVA